MKTSLEKRVERLEQVVAEPAGYRLPTWASLMEGKCAEKEGRPLPALEMVAVTKEQWEWWQGVLADCRAWNEANAVAGKP